MEGWSGIECPFINYPTLDSADFEKFHNSVAFDGLPGPFSGRADLCWYGQAPDWVPFTLPAPLVQGCGQASCEP
jgi:hypothetical protein